MAITVQQWIEGNGLRATDGPEVEGDCPATFPLDGPPDGLKLYCTRNRGHAPMHEAEGMSGTLVARWWDDNERSAR